jgi:hypothetical protein
MATQTIPLCFAARGRVAHLRELTGSDERAVSGIGTADALHLLDALVEPGTPDAPDRFAAADLPAADRDRLLTAVYERAFGDRIASTLTCAQCGRPFDLHFSLPHLVASLNRRAAPLRPAADSARFEVPGGPRFRLPTGADELAAAALPETEAESLLLSRCVENGAWPGGAQAFQNLLDEMAPLVDLELAATCPECSHAHVVQFDIQNYLLGAILSERPRLLLEIHRLASAYGWPLHEILSLTRSERRQLVEWIETEIPHGPPFR